MPLCFREWTRTPSFGRGICSITVTSMKYLDIENHFEMESDVN